jgi:glucosamine--fructose-6-phosphate aminotransferase (isomerizing)
VSLWSELHEQPETVARVVTANRVAATRFARRMEAQPFTHVVVAARGTSDNAARFAQYAWGARNRLTVALAAPSLFGVYHSPPRLEGALVVGISQSGQSPDLVEVLEEARRQGRPTLAITNEADSPLAASADHVLELHAGAERAVAATKTYTAQLAAVALVSASLSGEEPAELTRLGEAVEAMLALSDSIAGYASALAGIDQCAVLARGFNLATAFEWALKLQELAYVLAHPYSAADFLHGPIALVEPGFPVLVVAPAGPPHAGLAELVADLRQRRADLMVLSDEPDTLGMAGKGVPLPAGLPEWLTPVPAIVAGQLLAFHLAVAKGLDPDHPRGLGKITRTR